MSEKIEYAKLSAEEKAEIRRQLEAEDQAQREVEKKLKADYDNLKNEQVNTTFKSLQLVSTSLEAEKADIFAQFGALLDMKQEVHKLTDEQMERQQSHTFTSDDNKRSIIIGHNIIDRWGDDVGIGIERANKCIENLINDPKAREYLRTLLKPNSQGVLKASRVLDLGNKAKELGDKELIEAVEFIQSQWKPQRTSTYVKAKYLDENGVWQWLALSMSAV
ncbi:DUF3164 family protein [uncultured Draconibacterium sp.]|uniref:DUF3164 family protein n=1 Tax=uncultured Draconibacterium sp. TaxID=1573823 RepID=UPI0025E133BF|nr:DUF3164 family protein [uncultured Draconibacterium sp.]